MKFFNKYFFAGVGAGCLLSVLLSVGITFGFTYFAMRNLGDMASGTLMILYVVSWGAAWLGTLWWVKRYFPAREVFGSGVEA